MPEAVRCRQRNSAFWQSAVNSLRQRTRLCLRWRNLTSLKPAAREDIEGANGELNKALFPATHPGKQRRRGYWLGAKREMINNQKAAVVVGAVIILPLGKR